MLSSGDLRFVYSASNFCMRLAVEPASSVSELRSMTLTAPWVVVLMLERSGGAIVVTAPTGPFGDAQTLETYAYLSWMVIDWSWFG